MGRSNRPLIFGVPKSGNMFIVHALGATLNAPHVNLCAIGGLMQQMICGDRLSSFLAMPLAVGGIHTAPTAYNVELMREAGLTKMVLLVRDPRDALLSFWHHLNRPDVNGIDLNRWIWRASGTLSARYFDLTPARQFRELAERVYPVMQEWLGGWIAVFDRGDLDMHLNVFEQFVADPRSHIRGILEFYEFNEDPVLPDLSEKPSAEIDRPTNFRRGEVGAYREEFPSEIVALLDANLDRSLRRRFGWHDANS